MAHRETLVALVVALLLVTAGCSSASHGADQGADGDQAQATGAASGGGGESNAESGGSGDAPSGAEGTPGFGDRKFVRTAELEIRVDSFDSARSNLTTAVRANGGYVGDARMQTEEVGNETYSRGTIVLRVPVENYSAFLATVEGEGLVLESNQNTDDVTREYVDLEARLENLKRQRNRLRELYEQANTTEDVLAVEARLSEVQGEIERTEARLKTLRNQVALATITVHLREEPPERDPPERTHWYEIGFLDAFLESVDGVVVTLRALLVALAYAAPYLVVFGLPVVGLFALLKRSSDRSLPPLRNRGGDE